MKPTLPTADFDCVKMKNDIQAKILAKTEGMTTAELLAYFNTPVKNTPFWQYPLLGGAQRLGG
ncbi:MAG: hypothetical protein LBS63_02735 [Prevotellaceae bacterium]|jgi:hypothetical protein|nr:hypothetical protein [Prevotellaceae bacterium]